MKKWVFSFLIAFLAAFLLFIPVHSLHREYNEQLIEEEHTAASKHLDQVENDIKARLDSSLFYADFFEMIVSQNPGIGEHELLKYSKLIVERNPLIDSVSLAKDGIINFIYPLKGNEEMIGFNLTADSKEKIFLKKALKEPNSVAQAPVKTVQGSNKIFNRKPVIIKDTGVEEIWGFANVVIDFDKLVESTLLPDQIYMFESAIVVESEWAEPMIFGDPAIFEGDALRTSIHLPEHTWKIATLPIGGWSSDENYHRLETVVFYFFILIIFFLVMFFVLQYFKKRELSRIDALTQLLNKKTFEMLVKKILQRSKNKNGLLLMDFNNFKEINDTYGHLVGDHILTISAKRLMNCLKKGDVIGRIGGDEIMIFVKDVETEDLKVISERVVQQVEKPVSLNGSTIVPSVSIGFMLVERWLPFNEIYENVDKKMYREKSKKKMEKVTSNPCFETDY
ncbi:diguanylate cyclase domain-containing protein [Alkalibacterium kapii]|uniref:Sensor domain-containing diguanylate cyclase n=1 Tax=Alkalibacterium kapii TaxID=426704 RepID=A0A511ATD1_9LACT|nr:diguanylate cyclase [Alkalibacterium kapii]GEK90573.1 sensor domain-containing diguanylate cyclase [Alkalibacterium kapii]